MNCKLHNSPHAGNCRIAEIAICVRTCEKTAAVGHDPGMRYTIAAMLIGAGCTGSPNYHRTYVVVSPLRQRDTAEIDGTLGSRRPHRSAISD